MGDQRFTCGRYKNRTFAEIAKNDADFCAAVLKTAVCSKYYPEDFKQYLLSLRRPSISETNVSSFVRKWDESTEAEFRRIIGSPEIAVKTVHPPSASRPNANVGVFIRYFVKKCIFNVQQADATSYSVETFATIFPFRVTKTVPAVDVPVRQLFDNQFYGAIAAFMVRHFEDRCEAADSYVDLFLRNVHHFQRQHFGEYARLRLRKVVEDAVDADKSLCTAPYACDYLRQFPRLSQEGVVRYTQLRQMYNELCAAFGLAELGDRRRRHIRMLPEINCDELLSLLEPQLYTQQRATYVERFQKYLFFFVYAVESAVDHPVFFIDDPLYECLKEYQQYRGSRDAPEELKLCTWLITLVHRRMQPLHYRNGSTSFEVDDQNLRHIRDYMESYPGVESAVVDFVLPTSLLLLGIPIVTKDSVFTVFYSNANKSSLADFYEGIVRALMCPLPIRRVVIYNAYIGQETSLEVPAVKKEVLEFVRRHNKYDPARSIPVEHIFTEGLEYFFEKETIQWDVKYPRKSNPLPVYNYEDILGDGV